MKQTDLPPASVFLDVSPAKSESVKIYQINPVSKQKCVKQI